MVLGKSIYKLRTKANLSQEQFAEIFSVSQQSVQKWENEDSVPDINKVIKISKYFGVSLDSLILDNNERITGEMDDYGKINPKYSNMADDEFYPSSLMTEYKQCIDEGLMVEEYKDIFKDISKLPKNEISKKLGDAVFELVCKAKTRSDYEYNEPSDLEEIRKLRKPYKYKKYPIKNLEKKIHGAWVGRIGGCCLGKAVEGIHTDELIPFLKETDNYPLHRYILRKDITDEIIEKYTFPFDTKSELYADYMDGMPSDDDTNYMVLYQELIEQCGRDFTPFDVANMWITKQCKKSYYYAERVAYCNMIKGFEPPMSAMYKNPFREWIGAQIRGDYFGYINPGNPEKAAEMAWRDGSVSQVKNGIYGEMFVSAMIATAFTTSDTEDIILRGLSEIPCTSRLYKEINLIIDNYKKGISKEECFDIIHKKYDEYDIHGWCHTIPNAMIVVTSLLYGKKDYEKSICMAVETGFDTDCNGATVGSVLGVINGISGIPDSFKNPLNDTLYTSIFNVGKVKISDRVKMTMTHINNKRL